MNVLTVIGTRPEAIKLAPIIRELERRRGDHDLQSTVCVTGQHRSMLDQVLDVFGIEPHHDLAVMRTDQSPADVAAAVLTRLAPVLSAQQPDWVLVQGDTTTAAAAALCAFYAGIKVGHVEAGLRTHDKWQPFPEEVNRRLAGVIADIHFAPTLAARTNLRNEGISADQILVTGNTVIDALRWATETLSKRRPSVMFDGVGTSRPLVLVTAHRRENFGEPFLAICGALRDLSDSYGDRIRIVYAVHPNPNVWAPAHELLGGRSNVVLTKPLDYLELVELMSRARLILTDSGGIQEEAPSLGVPVLVLRDVTERPEAVAAGTVRMVGTSRERIVHWASQMLDNDADHSRMARAINPYGDGRASNRIVASLLGEPVDPFDAPRAPHVAAD